MLFLDPTNHLAFKRLFGNENRKEILIDFLNNILNRSGEELIQEVSILNPHQAPQIDIAHDTIVDVKCRDQAGAEYIVEMQVLPEQGFDKRVLYYAGRAYTKGIPKRSTLKPIIRIAILGFNFTDGPEYLSNHYSADVVTRKHRLKDFLFTFIELPKFNKSEPELTTITDQWIYFLKNAEHLTQIPEVIHEQAILWAFDIVERTGWTREEYNAYVEADVARTASMMRQEARYDIGLEEGFKKGYQQGLKEGQEEVRRLAVLSMFR